MKKFLFGCAVAISGLTMPLAAQDCCYPPQYDSCCEGDFNGFYIGGNVGVFTHVAHRNDRTGFLTDNSGWTTSDTDVTAGVQLGYDWQCTNKVFGLVADWNWTNNDRRLLEGTDNFIHNEHNWFTTIRARAGLTVCDALVYVTLGAAVSKFDVEWNDAPDAFHDNHTRWGWTGGVGTEFLLGCNWSLGAEVLFLHYSEHSRTFTGTGGAAFAFGHSDSAYVGRILLNYRFGDLCSCFF